MSVLKGGEFLIKESDSKSIFITEEFNEEQRMMKETVNEFLEKEVLHSKDRFEKKDYAFTESLMKKMGAMGFFGISIPQNYGGLGMSFMASLLVTDTISSVSGSLSTAYGAHTGIGTMPIFLYGSEKQKETYLPALISGEKFGAYCLTEPDAGSDANSGKTKATLTDDKKHYKINGQKMWISNAGFASIFIVFARIEDDKNVTAFIVPYNKDEPNGITFGEEEEKLGIVSSSTRQVFFNDTLVPAENLLWERGRGFKIALNTLNIGRLKLGVACLSSTKRLFNYSVNYANTRIQFSKPISSFGAIQKKLANMASQIFVIDAACYRVSKDIENLIEFQISEGKTTQEAKLKAFSDYAVECAIIKIFASETSQMISDEGIQIHGGMGFSKETPLEAAWRDARITRIYEGTNEINRLLIIDLLLKKALKGKIDLITPAQEVAKSLMQIPSFETPEYDDLLAEEFAVLKNLKKVFLLIAGKSVESFGTDLENQQQLLLLLADIVIEIYIAESGLLKVIKLASLKEESEILGQKSIAQLNLFHAVEKIKSYGNEATLFLSEGDERRMILMGLKRFTKYQNSPNPISLRRQIAEEVIKESSYCY